MGDDRERVVREEALARTESDRQACLRRRGERVPHGYGRARGGWRGGRRPAERAGQGTETTDVPPRRTTRLRPHVAHGAHTSRGDERARGASPDRDEHGPRPGHESRSLLRERAGALT